MNMKNWSLMCNAVHLHNTGVLQSVILTVSLFLKSQEFLHDARMIWNKMKDLDQREKEGYYMTHDGTSVVNELNEHF